jgi:hypothetical protein
LRLQPFDYGIPFSSTDFRKNPHLYKVGRGEQGVLLVEPYKSEILPHWRFRNPVVALKSAQKIYEMFLSYISQGDFVGADMARKYLMMGWTRARRYANYRGGKKYGIDGRINGRLPDHDTSEKAQSASIFKEYYEMAKSNKEYGQMLLFWGKKNAVS